MRNKRMQIWSTARFYVFATLIGLLIAIPFFWMISTSLKTRGALMALPVEWIPAEPSIEAYQKLFTRFPFARVILNSALVSVAYTLLSLISCSMAAFAFAKIPFRGREALLQGYLTALMIPVQSTVIPLFLMMSAAKLNNTYLSVIAPSLFRVFGILMLVENMKSIPDTFIDAARIDGASWFGIFRRIIVPLSSPAMATLGVITFMDSWNDYLWPLVMLTDKAKMTLPIALSTLSGQYETEYNVLMAGSLVSVIPIVLVYLVAQRYFKDGLMLGGIKG